MRFFTLELLMGASLVVGASAIFACSSQGDDCEANKSCGAGTGGAGGSGASGGTGATGGAGGDGGTCDTSKSPVEEACLVSDQNAIFVSPSGTNGADGTRTAPVKSITEAVTKAGGTKVVLVCNGTYDEHVMISDGARIYGGFDCTNWAYDAGEWPKVAPTTTGYAAEVSSVAEPVVVQQLELVAKDGVLPGESSVSMFIHGSANVSLARLKLEAGEGVTGESGVLDEYAYPIQADLNGTSGADGGTAKTCCEGVQSVGGQGGAAIPTEGQDGTNGAPNFGAGLGGDKGGSCSSGSGEDGNQAPATTTHATGASTPGTLAETGWTPAAGSKGNDGSAGQGGGGGGSIATAVGGGGGCGGCGGAGGPGGKGGGGSIALLSWNSTVTLAESALLTKDAGDGGSGADGQASQAIVGLGGVQEAGACPGGKGALGANGQAGGGGAGGVSAGIVHNGAAPNVDAATTYQLGAFGTKGLGGKVGLNDGIDGDAENIIAMP